MDRVKEWQKKRHAREAAILGVLLTSFPSVSP
jgi:hypothetical protein